MGEYVMVDILDKYDHRSSLWIESNRTIIPVGDNLVN